MRKQKLALRFEDVDVNFEGSICCSADSERFARLIWDNDDMEILERFYALFLNAKNEPVSWTEISMGGQKGTVVDVKLVIGHAILAVACGMIVFHNHPSGSTKPSDADIQMTAKLKDACNLHDMTLLDHLIITTNQYYSFTDEGIL